MAHETQVTGKLSELTAANALLSNGWEVSFPVVDEVYDIVAKDPVSGNFETVQVKTIQRRLERNNSMIVYAKNGKGEPYSPDTCSLIAGVEDGTVYLFENTGQKEYWRTDASAAKRWIKLTDNKNEEAENDYCISQAIKETYS